MIYLYFTPGDVSCEHVIHIKFSFYYCTFYIQFLLLSKKICGQQSAYLLFYALLFVTKAHVRWNRKNATTTALFPIDTTVTT